MQTNKEPLCKVVQHTPWKLEQAYLSLPILKELSLSDQLPVPDDAVPCSLQRSKRKQFSLKYLG